MTGGLARGFGSLAIGILLAPAAGFEPDPQVLVSEVEVAGGWPVTTVQINGSPRRFIVDTAANTTVIDIALAEELRLLVGQETSVSGLTAASSTSKARVGRFNVAGASRDNLEVITTDMSQFGSEVVGILGHDLTKDYSLLLDIPGGRLELSESAVHPRAANMVCLPNSRPERPDYLSGFALVEAEMTTSTANRVTIVGVVDSGAAVTVMNWAAAEAIGYSQDDPRLSAAARPGGMNSAGNNQAVSSLSLETLTIGPWKVPMTNARVYNFPIFRTLGLSESPAIILGADILNQRAFSISKNAREFCI